MEAIKQVGVRIYYNKFRYKCTIPWPQQPWGYHSVLWPQYTPWVFSTAGFSELLGGVTCGFVTTQTHNCIYRA